MNEVVIAEHAKSTGSAEYEYRYGDGDRTDRFGMGFGLEWSGGFAQDRRGSRGDDRAGRDGGTDPIDSFGGGRCRVNRRGWGRGRFGRRWCGIWLSNSRLGRSGNRSFGGGGNLGYYRLGYGDLGFVIGGGIGLGGHTLGIARLSLFRYSFLTGSGGFGIIGDRCRVNRANGISLGRIGYGYLGSDLGDGRADHRLSRRGYLWYVGAGWRGCVLGSGRIVLDDLRRRFARCRCYRARCIRRWIGGGQRNIMRRGGLDVTTLEAQKTFLGLHHVALALRAFHCPIIP
jgi:hypothetical protein